MSFPLRIAAAKALTCFAATLMKPSMSPLCRYGAPQQPAPSTNEHSTPLRSNTLTKSWPIAGCWYSTKHVGNTATEPCFFANTGMARFLNHVLNRCLAKGGSNRTDETPAVFSTIFRTSDPGFAPSTTFVIVGIVVANLPSASVCPMTSFVARLRRVTWPLAMRIAS